MGNFVRERARRVGYRAFVAKLLLTGVTGRVGRLLFGPLGALGHELSVMVRPRGAFAADARATAVGAGELPLVEAELGGRTGALMSGSWEVVVHAALDGAFFPQDARGQRRRNVHGALELISALRPRRFVLLSTVHVAGARGGRAYEGEYDVGQSFHNAGEEGMLEAELAVRAACARIGTEALVLRLGHVDGLDSQGHPDCFTTLGGFLATEAWNPRNWRSQLRVPGIRGARLALSPSAWVGGAAAALVTSSAAADRSFHLLAHPPTQEAFFAALADRTGFPGLRVQTPRLGAVRNPTRLEARAHAALGHPFVYLASDLSFDCTNAHGLLADLGVSIPDLSGAALRAYVDRLLDT